MDEKKLSKEANILPHPDYQQELLDILRSKVSPKILQEKVLEYHENDVAAVLEKLTKEERTRCYLFFEPERLSDVFEYLKDAVPYFCELPLKKRAAVLEHMDADAAVAVLRKISRQERSTLIDLINDEAKRDIALLSSFEEGEIGSRMTTNFIRITENLSVRQAMHELSEQVNGHDHISTIYVVDEKGIFYGVIRLKDLIMARENTPLENLILTTYPYVYAQETVEECLERLKEYSEDSIPVLGNHNRMLGVITSQRIIEMTDEEMKEDYVKLAGLTSKEESGESVLDSIRKRLPWLLILLGFGIVVSLIVGFVEPVVSELTIIICFQSLILDMAGNASTQSLGVMIRALIDEAPGRKERMRLVFKEVRIGVLNGMILGMISFAAIGGYIYFFKDRTLMFSFAVSGCVGAALALAIMFSALIGTLFPLLFKKLDVDPAVLSAPLITTINNLAAVVVYYSLTWIFLIQMLHLSE